MTSQPDIFGAPDVGGERNPLDTYDTPPWPTRALLHHLGERVSGMVWEPCAGAGCMVDELAAHPHVTRVHATDVAPRRDDIQTLDFMTVAEAFGWWIISNPPYVTAEGLQASDIVRHALTISHDPRVAMLVRLAFLEPCEDRLDLLDALGLDSDLPPPTDVLVLPRVHYIGAPSSNNQTSVWVVWDHAEQWRSELAGEGFVALRTYPPDIRNPTFDWSRL